MITNYQYQSKFTDDFSFVSDYINLVNNFYSTWFFGTGLVDYYNLDIENSNIDSNQLVGGSYEVTGALSGWRWRKILDFDVSNLEAVGTASSADEKGVTVSEKTTTCFFPIVQGIIPQVHDFVSYRQGTEKYPNYVLRNPPLYEVINIEKSSSMDLCFYKLSLKVSYITQDEIDKQLSGLYEYINYEKCIYPIDDAIILQKIAAEKRQKRKFMTSLHDQNSGLYFDTII